MIDSTAALRQEIKRLMVEKLGLQIPAEEIRDDEALCGPASLGLDSVDILILAVAIEKTYQSQIAGPEAARQMFQSVKTITAAVAKNRDGPKADR